jgi:hypothetical protein
MSTSVNLSLEALKSQIATAFANVKLGAGIGLAEAEAIDNFMIAEHCAECRLKDEKLDWQHLTTEDLNENYSSLSHFDAKGMRFHLPAYLLLDLDKKYKFSLEFALIRVNDYRVKQFSLLNQLQKKAVAAYLFYKLDDRLTHQNDIPEIHKALNEYWLVNSTKTA